MERPFSLLIKPVSADCNLNCQYCFYLEKQRIYPQSRRHRMSEQVLERLVQSYMSTSQPLYSFTWQGGEPTLAGTPFFERVISLQQKYGGDGAVVGNGLQTNATLIDEEMARLFAQYNFLVGCSLDGPPALHDRFRKTIDNKSTHARVIQGIELLEKHHVECNILILVSKANVNAAKQVYQYLVNRGHNYHQYIPCVEINQKGEPEPYAINGEEWGKFLSELFHAWYPQDVRKVSVRLFDAIVEKKVTGRSTMCTMDENCCQYFVVEYNGDVYPCDFYVDHSNKLGNVLTDSWRDLGKKAGYRQFGLEKKNVHGECTGCEFISLCQGDCPKHRAANLSVLCEGWKKFYHQTNSVFEELAGKFNPTPSEAVKNSVQEISRKHQRLGRNDPCLCGSGLKYKKCCAKK
ncbi:MAG: anaerobic sulfatase maturase [Proteobacteria bacterium]|nr:anaerobic sulfatase maturase [Pseudomonadota bacterium]